MVIYISGTYVQAFNVFIYYAKAKYVWSYTSAPSYTFMEGTERPLSVILYYNTTP